MIQSKLARRAVTVVHGQWEWEAETQQGEDRHYVSPACWTHQLGITKQGML